MEGNACRHSPALSKSTPRGSVWGCVAQHNATDQSHLISIQASCACLIGPRQITGECRPLLQTGS